MRLLNFSIGKVQTIEIAGEPVRTAHVKGPVAEPWIITEDGADGDQRAIHPDKLYAFPRTGYAHWGDHLGIDPQSWPDGFFGENLTLDVLDETDVRVGDVFALGDAVRLVVAGTRNPCAKLAWRLNQPRAFQKVFARSRNTGVYLGVLEAGVVRPGDRLRRLSSDPLMPTLADVCDFVLSHDPVPLAPLQRLLAFDRLSPTVRLILGSKLEAAERAADAVEGRWTGWRPFVIADIKDEATDIRSFRLRPSDGAPLCQPRPGQFVSVRMTEPDGAPITRSWSLSAYAEGMDHYRLTVRRQEGPGSNWLHRARTGAEVMLRAPAGQFHLDMGGFRPLVLVAAGIGVTPLLAMLHAHLTRRNGPPVHLIYGARRPQDAAFRDELAALEADHPQLSVTYVYSQSEAAGRPAGRITLDRLIEALEGMHVMLGGSRRIDLPWHEGDMYLCGPGAFCESLRDEMIARGGNPDHIVFEHFTAPQTADTDLETAQVRFARSGVTTAWDADSGLTLLDLAEAAGAAVDSDCRAGTCLTCKTRVIEGAATSDMGDGSALLCIGRPRTASLVLDC